MTTVYRRVLTEARPYWPHLILALSVSLLSIPAALLLPLPLKIELDSVLGARPFPAFVSYVTPPAILHSRSYLPLVPALVFIVFALAIVHEALGALRVVKAFGRERREQDRFIQRSAKGIAARMWVSLAVNIYQTVVAVVIALGTAAALYVGSRQVEAGGITVGEFVMVMSYLAQLYAPLQTITQKVADLQTGFVSAERVFSALDEPPEVIEKPNAILLRRTQGSVIFDRVSFGYDYHRRVLENVSFEIEPGTSVGIVG